MKHGFALLLVVFSCACQRTPATTLPARSVAFARASGGPAVNALAVRWIAAATLHPQASTSIGAMHNGFVVQAGEELVVYDLATGAIRTRYAIEPGAANIVEDTVLRRPILAPYVASDLEGHVRWSRPVEVDSAFSATPMAVATRDAFVLATAPSRLDGRRETRGSIVAVDRLNGAPIWRASEPDVRWIAVDERRTIVTTYDAAIAFEADGRVAWRWSPPYTGREDCITERSIAISGDAIVTARECGRIVVLDRRDGALAGQVALDGDLEAIAVDGSIAYAAVRPARAEEDVEIRAIDLRDARALWRAPIDVGLVALELVAGGLIVVDRGGTVRAIDRASGSVTASLPLGRVLDAWIAPGEPWALVARTMEGDVVAIEPRAVAPPPRRVRIHGRATVYREYDGTGETPLAHARVSVHGIPVVTDADGRFELTVEARGAIHVELDHEAVERASEGAHMGCIVEPIDVLAERGDTIEVAPRVFCPARC